MTLEVQFQPGDKVTVVRHGSRFTGIVKYAYNFGDTDDPDWYVELEGGDYVKQVLDNAQITLVEKAPTPQEESNE